MLFSDITILDRELAVREHMYVGVAGGKIAYIGDTAPQEDYGEVYDGRGRLLMPAFFNAHAHSPMTLMRGYGENLSLQDWLFGRIFPFEDKLTSEAVYHATVLAMAESLRFGIVSSNDMYYFCEDMVRAVADSGAKANISRSVTAFEAGSVRSGVRYREAKQLLEQFHGAAEGRIRAEASIHAEYTNTETSIREVAELAKEYGAAMHLHLSETRSEHEECKARHGGRTPARLFYELGAFDTPTIAAHCVWLEEADLDLLAEKQVTVATCPASNLKLASGICNVPALMRRGIHVALGTDSVTSNNSLNMIEEMKLFALLPKYRTEDPAVVTPREAIYAATRAGALAQGRTDCGLLDVGFCADLTVIDLTGPHMSPCYDLANNLVYSACGSDVVLTMADGQVLYRDGIFTHIDLERTVSEVEAARLRILAQL